VAGAASGRVGAVDLGATNLRAAVTDSEGTILARADRETPAGDGPKGGAAITEAVLATLREACAAAGTDPEGVEAVGIGSIGPLDLDAGAADHPPNVAADWIDLAGPLRGLCDCEVFLHNDCVAGAIGERFFADAGEHVVYVTLSTGVGAGAIVDGQVLRGRRGNAAEMGHVVVEPDGRPCGCGGAGHWEAYAAGAALPDFAREVAGEEGIGTALDLDGLAAPDLFGTDDPLARAVRERLGSYNARGVAATVHAFDPGVVAVGGAVALHNPEAILGPIRERVPDLLAFETPTIRLTELGSDAVLKGAVASALTGGTGER
jgi:glucokinase